MAVNNLGGRPPARRPEVSSSITLRLPEPDGTWLRRAKKGRGFRVHLAEKEAEAWAVLCESFFCKIY